MDAPKKPRGRPRKLDPARRRQNLTLRVREETRAKLEAVAARNSRSLSEEAELRLEQSFEAGDFLSQTMQFAFGPELAPVVIAIGRAMAAAGQVAGVMSTGNVDGMSNWLTHPFSYDQAVRAAHYVLNEKRPKGEPVKSNLFQVLEAHIAPGSESDIAREAAMVALAEIDERGE